MKKIEDKLRKELELLTNGNLGEFKFCKIEQIVLFSEKETLNYFTHIDFSSKYNKNEPFKFITSKPIDVGFYKLAISSYTILVKEAIEIYVNTALTGQWCYKDKVVSIDKGFISEKKFIPINNPTGGQYNLFVPLEYALYGSNFDGNYYVHEIYSVKSRLNSIIDDSLIDKIQKKIKEHHLIYRLDKLQDRIGNVVCKFNSEVFSYKPIRLGDRGIEYSFDLHCIKKDHKYCSSILQEHDGLVYNNIVNYDYNFDNIQVDVNQLKTSISIIDLTSGLTLFFGRFDHRVFSNYYSQFTPPYSIIQPSDERVLHFNNGDLKVELNNIQMNGVFSVFNEMYNASIRKAKLNDEWFFKKGYLKSYNFNDHEVAIQDIIDIINNNLLWDLQEIRIIDPYLCADDIISTAFKCEKSGIQIKALGSYATVHKNKVTQELTGASKFIDFKKTQDDKINAVLGDQTDLKVEFRTVYGAKGFSFHDRYIILKYKLNNDRVWSLGASINSIGNTHSIIQIVEAPNIIISLFDDLWDQTNDDDCIIFKNI